MWLSSLALKDPRILTTKIYIRENNSRSRQRDSYSRYDQIDPPLLVSSSKWMPQSLAIALESNPITDYQRDVAESPDVHVLQHVGEIEYKPESDLVGAGGVQTIRFDVVGASRTALKVVYHRPWEKDEATYSIYRR